MSFSTQVLSYYLYLLINEFFILKYSLRFVNPTWALVACILYAVGIIFFFYLIKQNRFVSSLNRKTVIVIALAVILLLVLCQSMVDPYTLKVDRWSAIHNFLYNLFNGIYPYAAQTHLGGYGSPFPVWQVFHIPFYLFGNVGLSFLVGVGLFLDSIRRIFGCQQAFMALLLLIVSPAFVYEVVVRSDLSTNFLVCAAIILYFHYYNITFNKHWLLLSVIIGLMASTRLSILVPFGIYFLRDFVSMDYRRQLLSVTVIFTFFTLTFLPFLLWNGEMLLFFEYNPFVLQSRQGNPLDFLLFIPLGIWFAFSWRNDINRYFFNTACLLLILVIVTFVHNMYLNDNWNELFESAYDITYFNMALPFLIVAVVHSNNKSLC